MLGAIIGDIAGSAYEWHKVNDLDFNLFPHNSRFTDDTVLTAATMMPLSKVPITQQHIE